MGELGSSPSDWERQLAVGVVAAATAALACDHVVDAVETCDGWSIVSHVHSRFLLQLDRDASDWTPLNSLHKVSNEPPDLISKTLAWYDCNFLCNAFVCVEVGP